MYLNPPFRPFFLSFLRIVGAWNGEGGMNSSIDDEFFDDFDDDDEAFFASAVIEGVVAPTKEPDNYGVSGGLKNGTSLPDLQKATPTTLSIGDAVKIKGLVNSSQYNGKTGIIVSAVDAKTNRCGVRINGNNTKVIAIQVTNLTLERKAKKPTIADANSVPYQSAGGASSNFGMLSLSYDDVAPTTMSARRMGRVSPTLGRSTSGDALEGINGYDDDNDNLNDDAELLDLDRRHLSHLRNPNSPYRIVARSALALHQLIYASDSNIPSHSGGSIYIESTTVYNAIRHRRLVHRILSSITTCLTTHNSPKCRSLSAKTLSSMARTYYASTQFDPRLQGIRTPASIATLIEDDCGDGCARCLITAVLEDGDDGVSSSALESLGRLAMDIKSDNLAAEIRVIAECANPTSVLMYGGDDPVGLSWTLGSYTASRQLQTKVWENVVFPRMQKVLHRLWLYTNPYHVTLAVPVVTAVLVHALTRGHDTMPSRRSLQMNKVSHAKRGWRENDAEGLAGEYVLRLLIPRLVKIVNNDDESGGDALGLATALVRMASVCPHAPWRTSACRHATFVLLRHLEDGMMMSLSMSSSEPSQRGSLSEISYTVSSAWIPIESLAGVIAMLVVALRGVPYRERAPGLTAAMYATLMYLPLGVPVHQRGGESPDLPICIAREAKGASSYFRLGRIGLLTEVALSLMLDGVSDTKHCTELIRRVLQSDLLASVWDSSMYERASIFRPTDDVLWVFCSVAIRLGKVGAIDASEWCNLSLILLDFFTRLVCDPSRRSGSPFADAGYEAYCNLFTDVLQRCGSFPPSKLSISVNMMPASSLESDLVNKTSYLEGGPNKQFDHVASFLTKVTTKILFVRDIDKAKVITRGGVDSVGDSFGITRLTAILVDSWLGCCVANYEASRSNEELLTMSKKFFPHLSSLLNQILNKHYYCTNQESADMVSHLSQLVIACFENIACMSDLLTDTSSIQSKEVDGSSSEGECPLAISMLEAVVTSTKEELSPTSTKEELSPTRKDSPVRQQIHDDAQNAIDRISAFMHNRPQSFSEDIVSSFQVSPLITHAAQVSLPSSPDKHGQLERCMWFLFNHGRLVIMNRTNMATKAVFPTALSSGFAKLIRPRNPLRLTSTFSHATIDKYTKVRDLPLLIPARENGLRHNTITLTGCSDPVSLIMSHGMQRMLRGDTTESLSHVITMRLHNITPVSIRNGVNLGVKISRKSLPGQNRLGDGSTCVAVSTYKHEIPSGDSITWEITLMNSRVGDLVVQTDVTFLDLEKEAKTNQWLSVGGESVNDHAMSSDAIDDADEAATMDITLPFMPIIISSLEALIPCPLVFFAGCSRCTPNPGQGDDSSFKYLWECMGKWQRILPFVIPHGQIKCNAIRTLADTTKGYVNFASSEANSEECTSSPKTGCAFLSPNGSRIYCTHQANVGDGHLLEVRSDSSILLESVVGTVDLQTKFLRFIFGNAAVVVEEYLDEGDGLRNSASFDSHH